MNEIDKVLRYQVQKRRYSALWLKILDILATNPRPVVIVTLKNSQNKISGEIIDAKFGLAEELSEEEIAEMGLKEYLKDDLIMIKDDFGQVSNIALKDIKEINIKK
jgi:hypothetical protein